MAGGANPQRVQQPNVYNQSAGAYNAALAGTAAAGAYRPQMVNAQTAVGGIGTYMNPYTSEVIGRTAGDIGAAQQMAMNQLGSQATQARAFGGSRQGVAEAQTNAGFIKQLADTAAQQRQQGFQTALGASQQDVANQMQAALANQQAGLTNAQLGLNAAGQMSNLAGQGFGFGQQIGQQQMQQGTMQQGLMQSLIDAARSQYGGYTGAPMASLSAPMAALGAANMGQQSSTQSQRPGLFNYLGLGLGML